jgi:ABC-type multidrug transport system fused ATPase/permease subunit
MAYVAQIPWIENASVRDNILFGLPMDRARYDAVLDACALRPDIDMFEDGELSEIGPNGINLSGGQKWRLTLARAVYSRAEILVMDDVFSAVDSHVGRHILEECLGGPLCAGRTIILVTHHFGMSRDLAKYYVELADGRVRHAGPVEAAIKDLLFQEEDGDDDEQADEQGAGKKSKAAAAAAAETTTGTAATTAAATTTTEATPRKFVEDETRERGAVKRAVWARYFEGSGGLLFVGGALVLFAVTQALLMGRNWWVKVWTGGEEVPFSSSLAHSASASTSSSRPSPSLVDIFAQHDFRYYIGVYILISLSSIIALGIRCYYVCVAVWRASDALFRQLTTNVLRTPLRWLNTTPQGRILNRFTRDISMMDDELLEAFNQALTHGFRTVGILASGVIVTPLVALAGVPLAVASWWLGRNYVVGSRPCKRLSSTNLSAVMDLFVASVDGAATIRAFGREKRYMALIYERIDDYAMSTGHFWLFYRWLGWRVTILCAGLAGVISALVVTDTSISAAAAGFALSFAVAIQDALFNVMRSVTFLETSMNSAERILEYATAPVEDQGGVDVPQDWPAEGEVVFKDVVVGYASDQPPVLKGVSFRVAPGERVGVVGRTGAGKSSLMLALFRFLETRSGWIAVDGIDVAGVRLADLRSRITIIPQVRF